MSRLGVMSEKQFKTATSPGAAGLGWKEAKKKAIDGRGSQIRLIDGALSAWDKIHFLDPNEVSADMTKKKKKALRTIAKACAYWISIKQNGGQSQLRNHRRGQIQQVMADAIGALGHFDPAEQSFAQKKTMAITGGRVGAPQIRYKKVLGVTTKTVESVGGFTNANATSLAGQYALEGQMYKQRLRNQFKAQGTEHHYSLAAGKVKDSVGLLDKTWDTIGLDDYAEVYSAVQASGGAEVSYLPKAERMQYLVMVDKTFSKADGSNYGTNPVLQYGDRVGDMWAMDRYGNLFVKNSQPINEHGYFNHSSFNAGNEVICAGVIVINDGVLAYIDNASGHYQPDEQALRTACGILSNECSVNFSLVRVGVVPGNGGPPVSYMGNSFLQGNNQAWNVNYNAPLNLSANIGAE